MSAATCARGACITQRQACAQARVEPTRRLPRTTIHGRQVLTAVETAIEHHRLNRGGVANALQRIALQDYEVGELARLQRT